MLALDWLRGLVMILMTVDHASGVFNAGRLMTDGTALYRPGTPLPAAQFLTRWMTHLCAPTFVFLAGSALALSVEKRRAAGESARAIDGFILTRGILLIALDPLWMSPVFTPGHVLLQVLYAIGGGLVAMVALRRLGTAWLAGLGFALIIGGDAFTALGLAASGGAPGVPLALLLTGGRFGGWIVGYPLLPWLAVMMLGWAFGRHLATAPRAVLARQVLVAGVLALTAFVAVRGLNGYGNMALLREDGSLVQWLHVSKYPPSLSFIALELGLAALCLAAFLRMDRQAPAIVHRALQPLAVLGQTALFFYLLHVHVLTLAAYLLGAGHRSGLAETYVAAFVAVVVLYPVCRWYRGYKAAHPNGWPRYV